MKSHILVATLIAAALGANAQTGSRSMPSPITVTVSNGQVAVSSAGYRLPAGVVSITWQLATDGYRFTSDSIDFGSAQRYFSCATSNYGRTIRCTKGSDAPGGRMDYRVSVTDGQGATIDEPAQPNVWIQNE
jgi:hypothetical protein